MPYGVLFSSGINIPVTDSYANDLKKGIEALANGEKNVWVFDAQKDIWINCAHISILEKLIPKEPSRDEITTPPTPQEVAMDKKAKEEKEASTENIMKNLKNEVE